MSINVGTAVAFLTLDNKGFMNGLKSAGRELGAFTDSTAGIGDKIKGLGGAMSGIGATLTKGLTIPIVGIGAASTKAAMEFETGMAKIKTIADTSKISLTELGDSVKKTSMETGQTIADIQEGYYDALSSGVTTDKVKDFVDTASKAAIGGFTTTQVAVDGLTTTLNAYGKSADEANKLANQMMVTQNLGKTTFGEISSNIGGIAATSSAAGMKTEELFSSLGVLTANGIKTSEAITGMKAALSNIIAPSEQATKAADALGFKFNVAEMKSKGWMGFLDEVREKLEQSAPAYAAATDKVNNLESKIKTAQEGKKQSAEQYKAEIQAQNKAIDELQKQKDKASNSVEKKQIEAEIQAHKDKIKTLKEEAEQAKKGYSPEQITAWKNELKEAKESQKSLADASQDTLMGYSTMFGSVEALNSVLALTSKSGKDLYKNSMDQMGSGKDVLSEAYNTMMDTPEMKMKKAQQSIKVAAVEIGEAFLPYVGQIADGIVAIVKAFQALPSPVRNAIGQTVAFAAVFPPLLLVGGKIISSFRIITGLFGLLGSGAGKAVTGISNVGKVFSNVGNIIKTGGGGILTVITTLGSGLGKGITGIIGGFRNLNIAANVFKLLPMLLNPPVLAVIAIIAGIALATYAIYKNWDKVAPYFKSVGEGIKKIFSAIGSFFKMEIEGWKHIPEVALFIMDGLFNGLKKGKDKVVGFFKDLGAEIKDTFKTIMGIHSPSRVFTEFGGFIGEGLVNGIGGQENAIDNKFSGIANKIKNLTDTKPQFGGLDGIRRLSSTDVDGFKKSNNIGATNRQFTLHNDIKMFVTLADTGEKGTKQLTNSLKNMTENSVNALKNASIELFMNDAVRD
ncbi:phage tail tape measure protein [Clostridium sp. DJ247]|uniref:phage tail tape measure protein n=1 Tax=Clostridium sp. DJ247 TaxID=2726188 RepID=UPI00162AF1FD|nr:phage tail tape measure protein [Clostridium sp. DJ247]MBC2579997.1 phage tail tape measure protein [Clostridium sp. DJ247]